MSRRFRIPALVLCLALFVSQIPAQLGAPGEKKGKGTVVLKAAQIIDGTGAAPIKDGAIMIVDDKISMIGPFAAMSFPAGTTVIDLGDATLLPGFVDAHTHIIGRVLGDPDGQYADMRDYQGFGAILGARNAEQTLLGGFTTIRNVGAPDFEDMALRKAINEGWVRGPRMMAAGHGIGITGF